MKNTKDAPESDADDLVLHAGPAPLHYSSLASGVFDGDVVILRP